ncbi:MAG TPA: dihydrolipoamide succinyltransferase, partial [Thiothrix sp.]|nr:dihydrolipoamide succinyltransferase [Thiothrix sp.]
MSNEIRVPPLPESVNDATIASWLKKEGDTVVAEEPLLELETDKVVLEVPAPHDGVLTEIKVEQGVIVYENDLIAVLEPVSEADQQVADDDNESDSNEKATETHTNTSVDNLTASPSVRKTMYENDVNIDEVHASGEKGRILKSDVQEVVDQRPAASTSASTPSDSTSPVMIDENRPQRRVPMSRLRQRVAQRLVEAQSTAAILTTFNEVDLSDLVRLRKTYQERFVHAHGIKLGFMSFFVKAATEALKRFPEVNAQIDGNDIIYNGFYDIGVAVSTERGLVVPIIRDTDQLGHADIEKAISDFAIRARDGKLEMSELMG